MAKPQVRIERQIAAIVSRNACLARRSFQAEINFALESYYKALAEQGKQAKDAQKP